MKSSKKLIFICENDLSLQIGGTIHVQEVLKSLKIFHPNIHLIAPRYSDYKIEIPDGVSSTIIKTPRIRVIKWLYFYLISTLIILKFIIMSKEKVVIYSREMPYNIFLPILTRVLNIPLIIELNGVLLKEMEELRYNRITYHFSKWMEKFILHSSTYIIAVSDEIKSEIYRLLSINKEKIAVVPNGADINRFYPMNKSFCRNQLKIDESKFIIGFIGSCYPFHDIETLLASIVWLSKKIPNLYVIIAGSGYMLEYWKKSAKNFGVDEKVNFTGQVPYNLANLYINSFDICFISDKKGTAGFPMKTLHYLLCNKPIVASNIKSISRYFKETKFFRLIEPGNVDSLINAVLDLYLKRDEIITEHRNIVLNNYTWNHTAQKIINIINKIV